MAFRYTSRGIPEIPIDLRQIAESVLGPVDWQDEHSGFCRCPGEHLHTTPTKDRACRVYLDAADGHAPTVFCFHGSCQDEIIATNFRLRSAIGKITFRATGHISGTPTQPVVVTNPFEAFLNPCFRADDILSIAPGTTPEGETRAIPEHGGVNLFTRDQWLARVKEKGGIHRVFSTRDGLFVRVNPVRLKSNGADKDVTAFRHTLIESDKIPKDRQERILRDSGLPIAALMPTTRRAVVAAMRL
jgi:hypothetical protein